MLKLKVGFAKNPRLDPLIDGTVKPKDIELDFVLASPGELFYRNLMHDEFDLFEMSISEFLMVMANPEGSHRQWTALPIFPRKAFNWLNLCVQAGAGIENPSDLKGKRIGVPDYPMTASLWMRIFFQELYGIRPADLVWYVGRNQELSHGGVLGLDKKPPPGIRIEWLDDNQTIDVMLDRGELDAAYWIVPPSDPAARGEHNIDRYGGTKIEGNPRIRKLFSDGGRRIVADYYAKRRVIPANHIVVLQKRILEQHPWVAMEILEAFQSAKEAAYARGGRQDAAYVLFDGDDPRHQQTIYGDDPYPYGLKHNRAMIEIIARNSYEEGLASKIVPVESLFDAAILET